MRIPGERRAWEKAQVKAREMMDTLEQITPPLDVEALRRGIWEIEGRAQQLQDYGRYLPQEARDAEAREIRRTARRLVELLPKETGDDE